MKTNPLEGLKGWHVILSLIFALIGGIQSGIWIVKLVTWLIHHIKFI